MFTTRIGSLRNLSKNPKRDQTLNLSEFKRILGIRFDSMVNDDD
jgi:hypothetical protein